jgi:hypothetical protein
MSEVLLPPWIIPEEETHEWLDEGSSVFRGAFAPGLAQRQSYGGLRLRLSRRHTVRAEEKAQLLSILASTRGQYKALRTKVHFALRGSFPSQELLTNNTFLSGTTGWSATGGTAILSETDRVLRVTLAGSDLNPQANQSFTGVQYAPVCCRAFLINGLGSSLNPSCQLSDTGGSGIFANSLPIGDALATATIVPASTSLKTSIFGAVVTGIRAGEYFSTSFVSTARCALVDNGENLLLRSDELGNGSWSGLTGATITSNAETAPDGTTTADILREDGSVGFHFTNQLLAISSAAGDYSLAVAIKAKNRTWASLQLQEATGSTAVSAYFNLSSGAVGTTAVGANWSAMRTSVVALGNSWYELRITARKTNAATSVYAYIAAATSDGTNSWAGGTTDSIAMWRATLSNSSVPSRLAQTTSSALPDGTAQSGVGLYVKGLPVSTSGLLRSGDWLEINGELKQATAALNSDAAGLGYLQFEPPLVRSPSNDDPVIFAEPMGKFLVSNIKIDNEFGTQARVTYDLEHIYE